MSITITDSTYILGTTPATKPKNFIQLPVGGPTGDVPFELVEGEGIAIYKTNLSGPDTLLASGIVPVLSPPDLTNYPNGRTWTVRMQLDIEQSPPVDVAPVIALVAPDEVASSDLFIIQGSSFDPVYSNNDVQIDGTSCPVIGGNTLELECQTPSTIPSGGDYDVTVTVGALTSAITSDSKISIVPTEIETVASVDSGSSEGRVSEPVYIVGGGFSGIPGDLAVTFNGSSPASIVDADVDIITVLVPNDAVTGPVRVEVGIPYANFALSTPIMFTRLDHTLVSLDVSSGFVGDPVELTGTNFSDVLTDNVVTFNGTPATVTAANETTLNVTVPAGATSGNIVVTIGAVASAGIAFTVS